MPALEDHPLADLFPLMGNAELIELANDIEANGLREPIWLLDGKILDGRNRYRACRSIDMDHRVEHYRGKDPLGFVVSKNLHRRHLDTSQRAMVAAKIATARGGRPAEETGGNSPQLTNSEAANLFNVSIDSVKDAKTVQSKGVPELNAAVESGQVPVSAAAEVAKLPKSEQKAAVKGGPAKVKEKAKVQRQKRAAKPPAIKSLPELWEKYELEFGHLNRVIDDIGMSRPQESKSEEFEETKDLLNQLLRVKARWQKRLTGR